MVGDENAIFVFGSNTVFVHVGADVGVSVTSTVFANGGYRVVIGAAVIVIVFKMPCISFNLLCHSGTWLLFVF